MEKSNDNYYTEEYIQKYIDKYFDQYSKENPEVIKNLSTIIYSNFWALVASNDAYMIHTLLQTYGIYLLAWAPFAVKDEIEFKSDVKNKTFTKPMKLERIVENKRK